MPRLNNERQEIYAKMRAKGMIPSKAAVSAGYASGSGVYTELEANPEIIIRVRELMDELEERRAAQIAANREAAKVVGQVTGYGKAWVLEKLAENATMAQSDGDYKEANTALKLIGEELGMFQGASAGEENDNPTPALDLDKFAALMSGSAAGLPMLETPAAAPTIDVDAALSLIEGQGAAAKRIRRDREAFNDSEANIALHPDSDPDDDENHDEEDPA